MQEGSWLDLAEIADAGVRRIGLGGALARATYAALAGIAEDLADGRFAAVESAPSWESLRRGETGDPADL